MKKSNLTSMMQWVGPVIMALFIFIVGFFLQGDTQGEVAGFTNSDLSLAVFFTGLLFLVILAYVYRLNVRVNELEKALQERCNGVSLDVSWADTYDKEKAQPDSCD